MTESHQFVGHDTRNGECPICGHDLPANDGVRVDLDSNIAVIGDRTIRLAPMETEILYLLADKMPRIVRTNSLMMGIYGSTGGPDSGTNSLEVQISALRQKIANTGLVIEVSWTRGYRLRMQDKSSIQYPAGRQWSVSCAS